MALDPEKTLDPSLRFRFRTAQDSDPYEVGPDIDLRKELQTMVQNRIKDLANLLNRNVKDCHELEQSYLKLEEALMWTGKAIFK